jgi:hypothetical protein
MSSVKAKAGSTEANTIAGNILIPNECKPEMNSM